MKSLFFGFSRPLNFKFYAQLIMWWDHTKFDHAYVRFPSAAWECDFIYQSSGTRTNFMSGTYFKKLNVVEEEYEIKLDEDAWSKIGALCVKREGRPYPIMEILGIIIVKLTYWLSVGNLKIKNPLADSLENDCIEEQAAILSEALGLTCPLDLEGETPKPYRNWLASLPGMVKTT